MRASFLAMTGVIIGLAGFPSTEAGEPKPPRHRLRASDGQPGKAAGGKTSQPPPMPAPPAEKRNETAIFAGGCFWCTESAFEQLAGVVNVESGYCGGTKATANYDLVHLGTTGHAEAIRVTYDQDKVTYEKLLDVFFDSHDPTQWNRQGEDEGRQYRSAIFFADDEQREQAQAKIADLKSKRVFKRRIVTKLEPLKEFFPAEAYHQDFARRNPLLPYIQTHAVPRAYQVRTRHPELIRNRD